MVRKFGNEARVGRIHTAIADVGQSVGINFAFERIMYAEHRQRASPDTLRRLVWPRQSDGESVFYNYFVRGRDIGDDRVLVQIGCELDLDVRVLRAYLRSDADIAMIYGDNARAHRLGINGVPAFVFDGVFVTCGAQGRECWPE